MFLDAVSGLCFWTLSLYDVFDVNVSRIVIPCRVIMFAVCVGNLVVGIACWALGTGC